jgi:two-component system phosphate regulon sensor histidine kinase PhoR
MTGKTATPWASLILAVATAAGMLIAGINIWLTFGVLLLWLGSIWLSRPEPVSEAPRSSRARLPSDAMGQLIEPLGFPLILFDRERIVAANLAARTALGSHIVGQDARIALRHPEAVRLLDMEDGSSVTLRGLTTARSLWQLTRMRIDERSWMIELIDRTAEADISRAHTDFVANASHELRTPLASIIGYVETLAEPGSTVDAATAARFHETVLREAKRMQGLVSDLMSLSQLEAEKHDVPADTIDLGRLAERLVGEFPSGRVTLARPEGDISVTGDTKQLEQLLRNLIDNALKYGDSEKPVAVTLKRAATGNIALTVKDTGPGIAAEHLPHLTRRFYRTDPGRSRAAGGTGLGLAIVKHIVERHRGTLDITSKPGLGTSVTIGFSATSSPSSELS